MSLNHCSSAINDKNRNIIVEEGKQLEHWKEHFEKVLNSIPPENPILIDFYQMQEIKSISIEPISLKEVKGARLSLRKGN